MPSILAPLSAGELIDKITILEIKAERITDQDKLVNIKHELSQLERIYDSKIAGDDAIVSDRSRLKRVNETLWDIEDRIRQKENAAAFDDEFIELARAVYVTNDERSEIKRRINQTSSSEIMEEKSYENYTSDS